jgi:hypothetical protein
MQGKFVSAEVARKTYDWALHEVCIFFLLLRSSMKLRGFRNQIINMSIEQAMVLCQIAKAIKWGILILRVTVGLNWTRARASNPRFGQGWTQCLSPTGWTGQALLTERVERVRVVVRRVESDTASCPMGWIGQGFLSARTPNPSLLYEPKFGLSAQPTGRTVVLGFELGQDMQARPTGWPEWSILVRARALG